MDVLMELPHETIVRPGHTDPTTIGDEWENNEFVRLWRGLDEEGSEWSGSRTRRRRWCCGRPTTTVGTRPGCAGPTAAMTSFPGSRVSRD